MIAIPQLRMAKLISFMDDAAKPGGFDLLVCILPLQSAHEAAGATGTRHSPRPPRGREIHQRLGRVAPRDREAASWGKDEGCVPRMLRSAPHFAAWCAADPGPIVHSASPWVPALRSSVKNAAPRPGHGTHCFTRYRDDRFALEKDEERVPLMVRSAPHFAAWCAADPRPIVHSASPWVPALRSSVKNAAPRPGHGTHCFTRYRDDRFAFEKDEECVPRMLRSAPHFAAWCAADPGPIVHSASPWVPALRSSVKNAAPRPDTEHIASHATGMTDLHSRKMRNADPGPIVHSASPWVPALRCIVKNAAPRPGHEMTALQPNYLLLF